MDAVGVITPKKKRTQTSQWCSAIGCKNSRYKNPGLGFFRFPRDEQRCRRWVINSRREDLLNKSPKELFESNVLCAVHFEDSQFANSKRKSLRRLKAVPTVFEVPNAPTLPTLRALLGAKSKIKRPPTKKRRSYDEPNIRPSSEQQQPEWSHPKPSTSNTFKVDNVIHHRLKRKINTQRKTIKKGLRSKARCPPLVCEEGKHEAKKIASKFREVASFPSVSSGSLQLNGATLTLESSWTQRDIEQKEQSKYVRNHIIDISNGRLISQCGPQDVANELWNKTSPSGKYRAILRSATDKQQDKQYLEIYDTTKKLKTIDVLASEKHGKIINDDGQFGTFEWSSSEGHLLYMAEKKKQKTGSFFDPKAFEKNDDKCETKWGAEFEHEENWGEQLTDRVHPVICILDIESGVVSVLENVPDDLSPGQAIWTPDDAGVIFCAWNHEPYRLGLRFCIQRRSALYHLDLQKGAVDCLSQEGRCVRMPRFSLDMSRLVYLDTPEGGAHFQCSRLMMIDWATKENKVVVDIVRHPSGFSFPGLYTMNFQRHLWFDDNIHIALETSWRSENAIVIINTNSGNVTRLDKADEGVSMSMLSVQKNIVFLSASSLTKPPFLLVAQLANPSDVSSCKWIYPDGDPQRVDWLNWKVLQHTPLKERKSSINENLNYESIICLPKLEPGEKQPPLIVFSHGGPHTAFSTAFTLGPSFFCLCGYAVLMVNYRGSLGFGQDNVESLLGNIGSQDVKDVESAMMEVIADDLIKVDANCLTAFGGSHGGFLTTHLIGQYPDTFKAAASRNPVTNLASMFTTTDIRDWIFVEGGFDFEMRSLADDSILPSLWRASPMAHVDKVTTPMMLMTGLDDKRVPPAQSMEYYKALKARNVPAKWLCYPGNHHGIAKVDAEADCYVNTVLWFNQHISQ